MLAIADIDSEAAAAGHLYGLPADEFIAARNDLVRSLRAEGQRELAAAVALLRRPTVVAAELNRVLRISPSLVADLLDCAAAVRRGHQQLLDGVVVDVASRLRAHRQVAAELAELAGRDHGVIQSALEAASLDEKLHDQLLAATFATEPTPQTGFDLLTPTATVSSLSEARKKRQDRERKRKTEADRARTDRRSPKGRGAVDDGADDGTAPGEGTETETETEAETEPIDAEAVAEARDALRLAERRTTATRSANAKAVARVDQLSEQLEAARRHVVDTEAKVAAAEANQERAEAALADLVGDAATDIDDEQD
ncbi:MAG: hypothetical protein AAF962_25975 [Actinomycetota bacterium]